MTTPTTLLVPAKRVSFVWSTRALAVPTRSLARAHVLLHPNSTIVVPTYSSRPATRSVGVCTRSSSSSSSSASVCAAVGPRTPLPHALARIASHACARASSKRCSNYLRSINPTASTTRPSSRVALSCLSCLRASCCCCLQRARSRRCVFEVRCWLSGGANSLTHKEQQRRQRQSHCK